MTPRPPIFLSASVPYGDRARAYPPDPIAIREAIRGLVAVALPRYTLVFGGHPAISPMVWEDASSLGAADSVFIYQSRLFEREVPREACFFQKLVWTPTLPPPPHQGDLAQSLKLMRDAMIVRRLTHESSMFDPQARPDLDPFAAGVFIGGMNGVIDEWDLFRTHYPNVPALIIGSTKGATLNLLDDPGRNPGYPPHVRRMLMHDQRYRHLFRTLLP